MLMYLRFGARMDDEMGIQFAERWRTTRPFDVSDSSIPLGDFPKSRYLRANNWRTPVRTLLSL